MPENRSYLPEGWRPTAPYSLSQLQRAMDHGDVLQGTVVRCDGSNTLTVSLGHICGSILREDTIAPWVSGADRDISILSTVGKDINFTVKSITADEKGMPVIRLSRREAQEKAMEFFSQSLKSGTILSCRVTHLTSFGAFLDIGYGIIALLPIELISVSRLTHAQDRFRQGQKILAAVKNFDPQTRRITMTHRELLGTWMENASRFSAGDTVEGIVRSVKEYGSFIELAPNLSGLAENRMLLHPGERVSVYIKTIRPERMKIKLQVIARLPATEIINEIPYQITDGKLTHWIYSPPEYEKTSVETIFKDSDL